MIEPIKNVNQEDIVVEQNVNEKLIKVKLPENWFYSQSSYDFEFSKSDNKNFHIYKINNQNEPKKEIHAPDYWNIRKGDYFFRTENKKLLNNNRIEDKQKLYKLFLILSVILSGLIVYGISYLVGQISLM